MLSREDVLALAPDVSSAAAAEMLAGLGNWDARERGERGAWGEIRGSGAGTYRVCVGATGSPATCSCPSRKRPCKHALALLLWLADEGARGRVSQEPAWAEEILSASSVKVVTVEPKPRGDHAARARRASQREGRVAEGVAECRAWLEDLMHQGLGAARASAGEFWERPAARLVDAQAPGLARQVRRLRSAVVAPGDWARRGLMEAARLHVLLAAHDRLSALPDALREEARARLGWTTRRETVLAGEGVRDVWAVVGVVEEIEDRLRVRRTWLWGCAKRREAVILDFAVGDREFPPTHPIGTALMGEVAFYPGARPWRALVKDVEVVPWPHEIGETSIDSALDAYARALATDPWVERVLMVLRGVRVAAEGDAWVVVDAEGEGVTLIGEPWRAISLSCGAGVCLSGEYDGQSLRPMAVWDASSVWPMGDE